MNSTRSRVLKSKFLSLWRWVLLRDICLNCSIVSAEKLSSTSFLCFTSTPRQLPSKIWSGNCAPILPLISLLVSLWIWSQWACLSSGWRMDRTSSLLVHSNSQARMTRNNRWKPFTLKSVKFSILMATNASSTLINWKIMTTLLLKLLMKMKRSSSILTVMLIKPIFRAKEFQRDIRIDNSLTSELIREGEAKMRKLITKLKRQPSIACPQSTRTTLICTGLYRLLSHKTCQSRNLQSLRKTPLMTLWFQKNNPQPRLLNRQRLKPLQLQKTWVPSTTLALKLKRKRLPLKFKKLQISNPLTQLRPKTWKLSDKVWWSREEKTSWDNSTRRKRKPTKNSKTNSKRAFRQTWKRRKSRLPAGTPFTK